MRDKANSMPRDPDGAGVTALRVWHCNYASLAPLAQYPNLTMLVVATYPDMDLEPVASLGDLQYLSLLHLPGVTDLAPLARLPHLRTVRLSTLPSWDSSGKVTEVASLAPLALLPELAHLELFGVRPASKSLQDLENAVSLTSVRVSKYPKAEVTRYRSVTGVSDAFAPSPGIADWNSSPPTCRELRGRPSESAAIKLVDSRRYDASALAQMSACAAGRLFAATCARQWRE